jgi:hypothetical protein
MFSPQQNEMNNYYNHKLQRGAGILHLNQSIGSSLCKAGDTFGVQALQQRHLDSGSSGYDYMPSI